QAAFENLMTRGFCNSHCLSQFAAFFLDVETKISTVENFHFLIFVLGFIRLLVLRLTGEVYVWHE
ncbi:MAG: hypothetical protein RLZZ535_3312, partial [Cyanobacteriota bacterium]